MTKVVLLDSGPLGMYANPKKSPRNELCRQRVNALLVAGDQVKVPGIAEYEVRRELQLLQLSSPAPNRMTRFDVVIGTLGVIPLTGDVMQRAAVLWAEARRKGIVTAPREALDGDVILVAQALVETAKGDHVEIATSNSRDLGKLYPHVLNWDDLTS